jgi:xanthine dehydrogenase YagS FAD-binding subunit
VKSFEYSAPKTVKEATALLSDQWGETEVLAGGTDLITSLKQEITAPKRVVSLKNIAELRGIKAEKSAIRVGAMTSLNDLAANADVQKNFPALVTAVKNIASQQMLTMGTVGGDLCQRPRCWYYRNGHGLLGKQGEASLVRDGDNRYHAIFGTDGPALFVSASSLGPALVALDATLVAEGPKGKTRKIAASEFFRAPKSANEREIALKPNEVLTEISIPVKGLMNATYEVRHRYGLDWPYVTATVAFAEKNGAVSDTRVVLGHVAATPWLAIAAAKALNGARFDVAVRRQFLEEVRRRVGGGALAPLEEKLAQAELAKSGLDESAAAKCGDAAAEGAKPLSRNEYKIQLVKAAVKRAALAAHAA